MSKESGNILGKKSRLKPKQNAMPSVEQKNDAKLVVKSDNVHILKHIFNRKVTYQYKVRLKTDKNRLT